MPETEGNELSVDELKDVSGGLKGDHIMQHQLKGDRVSPNQLRGDELRPTKLDEGLGGLGCNAGGWESLKKGQKKK